MLACSSLPRLLAGTDLGLLGSPNGGLTWAPEARERDGFVYSMAGPGLGTRLQLERLTAADCQRRVTKA